MKTLSLVRWACLTLVLGTPSLWAQSAKNQVSLLARAELHEKIGEWDRACEIYEALLRSDRSKALKDRYRTAVNRLSQFRRHRDLSFQKEVLSLNLPQSLELYALIRDTLLEHGLERRTTSASDLFRKGAEEFEAALSDSFFVQTHVAPDRLAALPAYRAYVRGTLDGAHKLTPNLLQKKMREVALAAQDQLGIRPTVAVMEFASGACHGLDEYTAYLTPAQLRELLDSIKGRTIGIGINLTFREGKILVAVVQPYSPAAEQKIDVGDQILAIDKKGVMGLPTESVHELLEGSADSTIEIDLLTTTMGMRSVMMLRRPIYLASVGVQYKSGGVGVLQITCFQDTTLQEFDDALFKLGQMGDVRGLVLDLRGNPGGSFEAAIELARRFLSSGNITATHFADPKFNVLYQSRNPNALTLPVFVVLDGDTASAAEVFAGALKENDRARLIGAPTFGKGCTQCIVKLTPIAGLPTGGLRLTIARFTSPKGRPYSGVGIQPDLFAPSETSLNAAVAEMQKQLGIMLP